MSSRPFLLVAGARPNFMKVAPIAREFRKHGIAYCFLNTGQHHDPALSSVFLKELKLGRPDYHLGVGSGSHAQTTARVLERGEPILQKLKPRAVIVVGDVNSTLAMALAASKLHLPVVHVEAGLRSGDRTMPEEVNRILTDQISDLLLTSSLDANEHLRREGIPSFRIRCVGNVMMDSLVTALKPSRLTHLKEDFFLMTFHRPSNVDQMGGLKRLLCFLEKAADLLPIHLPLHPRTRAQFQKHRLWGKLLKIPRLHILEPMGYFAFIQQMRNARAVVTDSGGVQEETSFLRVPCLIMRTTTERPICVDRGTAELMGEDYEGALKRLKMILNGRQKKGQKIHLWDGQTARRIVKILRQRF